MRENGESRTVGTLETSYLFSTISSILRGAPPEEAPNGLNWRELVSLARRQNVANIFYYAIEKLNSPIPKQAFCAFFQEYRSAVLIDHEQREATNVIFQAFNQREIRYLPLKGCVLKSLYPSPDMRTMCDVDVLVDVESLNGAEEVLRRLDFELHSRSSCHDIYCKSPYVTLELHRQLFDPSHYLSPFDNLSDVWSRAIRKSEDSFEYEMSLDDFYLYLWEHMAKHFRYSGIQIRNFIDVWLFLRRYGTQLDRGKVNNSLKRSGLTDFVANGERLAEVWFDGVPANNHLKEVADSILQNRSERDWAADLFVDGSEKGDSIWKKVSPLLRLIFPSRENMERWAPSLCKVPFALPFYWLALNVRRLFKAKAWQRLFLILTTRKDDVERLKQTYKKTGFK